MIVWMKLHAKREEIQAVCDRAHEFGYKVHSIEGEERVVIGIVGVGDVTACLESIEAMSGVERAMRIYLRRTSSSARSSAQAERVLL